MTRRWISSSITAEQADARSDPVDRDLTLAETDALNMGSFCLPFGLRRLLPLPWRHQRPPCSVCFYAGERSGDTVTLYYQPEQCGAQLVDTAGSGEEVWAKVTVAPQSGRRASASAPTSSAPGRTTLLSVTRPLTGEELTFFNTQFFNSQTTNKCRRCTGHAPQPVPHLPVR